jgi:hypothetical protein
MLQLWSSFVGDPEPEPQVHALRAHAFADMGMQELIADRGGNGAMIARSARPSCRGRDARSMYPVAVDLEQEGATVMSGKSSLKG